MNPHEQQPPITILVTGGAGYIGSALVARLNALPEVERVYVLDNLSRSPLAFFIGSEKWEKVRFIKADILDAYALEAVIGKVDVVCHLAAFVSAPYHFAQNVQYEQINKWGSLNLVRCIRDSRSPRLRKVIYLSSAAVYGLKGAVTPGEAPEPTNAYGKSKLAGEAFIGLLRDQCDVQIIRAGNVFGFNSNFRTDSVLNHFIFHGLVDGKILIYGDGQQQRPFVALQRLVTVMERMITGQEGGELVHSIDFNASLTGLKDWLRQEHLPELEYTFVNPNISYEGQYINGLPGWEEAKEELDIAFDDFRQQIRISATAGGIRNDAPSPSVTPS